MIAPARQPTVSIARASVGGAIYVPAELVGQAQRAASVLARPNPAYTEWLRRSKRAGHQVGAAPPDRYTSAGPIWEGAHAGGYWLPRHAPIHVASPADVTTMPPAERLSLAVQLRPYQRAAVDAFLWERSGVIVAPCGAGKTTLGAAAIAELATPALVLVHTLDLAEQWRARALEQLGVEAGIIGDSKVDLEVDGRTRRVVVATIQTLATWSWAERYDLGSRFGFTLLDESHHVPARTFAEVLAALPGRYRLGLTATPKRRDGLEDILWWTCGPAVYTVAQKDLERDGFTLRPTITWLATGCRPKASAEEWTRLVDELAGDEGRNQLIVDEVVRRAGDGRCILVLADRVAHCIELARRISEAGHRCEALTSRLTRNARTNRLAELRSGDLHVVTATSLADEGLDVARLDTVVFAMPTRNEGRVQQRVGRALRPGSRPPEVLDLVDDLGASWGAARARRRLYRELGWAPPPLPRPEE